MNKDSIKLRQRTLKNGNTSLYLDIYIDGMREYEYLKLYLVPENNRQDKQKNKETMLLAESVRAKRLVEMQQGRFDFGVRAEHKIKMHEYSDMYLQIKSKEVSASTMNIYRTIGNHIKMLPDCYVSQVNNTYIMKYISTFNVKDSSLREYLHRFQCFMNYAKKHKYITNMPDINSFKPSKKTTERAYLTLDEIKKLIDTPSVIKKNIKNDVKPAFLFACLTGFRFSDLRNLTWNNVSDYDGGCRIVLRMQKTKHTIYQDINAEARKLLGERKEGKVFPHLTGQVATARTMKEWVHRSGINKDITFHCSRHTFALLLLNNSVDIYTVSKLLGHTDIKTTQIYAHILDKKKQEAMNSLPSIFD